VVRSVRAKGDDAMVDAMMAIQEEGSEMRKTLCAWKYAIESKYPGSTYRFPRTIVTCGRP